MTGNQISKRSSVLPILLAGLVIGAASWAYMSYTTEGGPANQPQDQTKTYTNSSFGFSVAYPQTWNQQECNDNATTLVALGDRDQLVVCASDAPLNAYVMVSGVTRPYWEGTLQDQVTQARNMYDDVQVTQVTVDGVPATRVQGKMKDFKGEGFPQYIAAGTIVSQVIFVQDDKLYRMHFQDLATTGSTEEFDRIVQSFKFSK